MVTEIAMVKDPIVRSPLQAVKPAAGSTIARRAPPRLGCHPGCGAVRQMKKAEDDGRVYVSHGGRLPLP